MYRARSAVCRPDALGSAVLIAPSTTATGSRRASIATAGLAGAGVISMVVAGILQVELQEAAPDLALTPLVLGVYLLAFLSAEAVGTALIPRRDGHPVGWCYLSPSTHSRAGCSSTSTGARVRWPSPAL